MTRSDYWWEVTWSAAMMSISELNEVIAWGKMARLGKRTRIDYLCVDCSGMVGAFTPDAIRIIITCPLCKWRWGRQCQDGRSSIPHLISMLSLHMSRVRSDMTNPIRRKIVIGTSRLSNVLDVFLHNKLGTTYQIGTCWNVSAEYSRRNISKRCVSARKVLEV